METIQPISPERVPKLTLASGDSLPMVGLGTFGSDNYGADEIARAVKLAVKGGYRHIDCAAVYGNEKEIGQALKELFDEGVVRREELWITSKVWNDMHHDVERACRESLERLGLDYLDLYLVHWPFPNYHAPKVSVESRDPNARPYIHEDYMKVWRSMEALLERGWVRNIGTSNMTRAKMDLLLRDCRVRPACNEMELHPHFQQPDLVNYMRENGIAVIGFCPIGSPNRPERDKTPEDTVPIEDPVIVEIARRHGVHPAIVCLKWAVQNGHVPIPFSVKPAKFMSNLQAAVEDPLSEEEMQAIRSLDRNCRFIKGQVFLWKGASSWHDLWDEDGIIRQ